MVFRHRLRREIAAQVANQMVNMSGIVRQPDDQHRSRVVA
jgi:hypothetical protein